MAVDIRLTRSGDNTVIELQTSRARTWYAKNVPGAPAVSAFSVVMQTSAAQSIIKRMTRDRLVIENADDN